MSNDPRWLELARKEIGVKEWPGTRTNPVVSSYYHEAVDAHGVADSVPWCAAFAGAMIRRAGYTPWGNLMARGALNWGTKLSKPIPGAIVVFKRGAPPSGHVAIVERVGPGWIDIIGGNQSDAVTRIRRNLSTANVLGYRWPPGAALLTIAPKALKFAQQGVSGMDVQEIMEKAQELHSGVDTLSSLSAGRKMAKDAIALIFYLAKLQAPAPKALPKALKLPKPRRLRKTPAEVKRAKTRAKR